MSAVVLFQRIEMLERENDFLRKELKYHLVSDFMEVSPNMSEEEAEKIAEREIVQMIAHNEGAE